MNALDLLDIASKLALEDSVEEALKYLKPRTGLSRDTCIQIVFDMIGRNSHQATEFKKREIKRILSKP